MISQYTLIVPYVAVVMMMVAIMSPSPMMVQARYVRAVASSRVDSSSSNSKRERQTETEGGLATSFEPVLLSSFEDNQQVNPRSEQQKAIRGMAENEDRMASAKVKKSLSSSSPPRPIKTRRDLERGSHANQDANVEAPRKRRVEVRNLEFESCGQGGTQYVAECTVGTELHCYHELTEQGAVIINRLVGSDYFVVCVDTPKELEILRSLTHVVDLEEDPFRSLSYLPERIRPADRRELQSNGQTIPYGISMVKADAFWAQDRGGNSRVCIIDTGLYVGHEDMQGATVDGSNNSNQVVTPWNEDQGSHGTHVAGTIAAVDNSVGVVGIAPDADLFIVRVFQGDQSQFAASSLAAAMDECGKANANVISMSLGGASASAFERNTVDSLANNGIMLVAASGNSGAGANPVEYPAGYDNVISVGAVDGNQQIADFSSHNSQVDVSAPGVDILSLINQCSNCYASYSGTSMATPHVSGVVALLMSKYAGIKSREEIRGAIEASAQDFGACGLDRLYGNGIVDVVAAAAYLDSGAAAAEQTGCVNTKVTVKTDNFGSETSYTIRNKDTGAIVYKNGPFENSQTTYTDEFQLPPGCYEFEMKDSYGDGMCCEQGSGFFKVEFNGVEEVFNDAFLSGPSVTASFGCNGSGGGEGTTPTPTAPPSSGSGNTSPFCGNGVVESGEECDDGNTNDGDSCTNACTIARCGDGIIGPGEQCDDGNTDDSDACRNDCMSGSCGDGIIQAGEECDDGNTVDDDSCTNLCRNPRCGDGLVQPGEECDDANSQNGDGCSSDCKIESITTSCQTGQSQAQLILHADQFSYSENELYFFESTGESTEDLDFIWIGTERGIENNKLYELSECVDSQKCYKFYFFDNFGDGLWGDEGLKLLWNGVETLVINPREVGDLWEGGPAVYWMRELGLCNNTQSP